MFVVTLPKSAAKNPKAFALKAKNAGAQVLEIRGDLTPGVKPFFSALPLLVSPRSKGSAFVLKLKPQFVDLELREIGHVEIPKDAKLIASMHDYQRTPPRPELQRITQELSAVKPWAIKIVTTIKAFEDIARLIEVKCEHGKLNIRSIVTGMGEKAHLIRLMSPLSNAFTYSFLDGTEPAAPGQVPLSLSLLASKRKLPKLYGLLGGPGIKSLSPLIHNTLFNRHKVDALYSLFLTRDLDEAWKSLTKIGLRGFSITSPWKRAIVEKLDKIEAEAARTGAVNTAVKRGDKWIGYPRDAEGMLRGYPFLKKCSSVSILGSGGVVPEVVAACRKAGIKDIRIFARNAEDSAALTKQFGCPSFPLAALPKSESDLLICTISTDIPFKLSKARRGARAIDLRYSTQTRFMSDAKKKGYAVSGGLPMLLHQALAQFELFTGKKTNAKDIAALQATLKKFLPATR